MIAAGASTPKWLIDRIVKRIEGIGMDKEVALK